MVSDQNLYIRDDGTSPEKMSIAPKVSKMDTQFSPADVSTSTLSASKRSLIQFDAVIFEGAAVGAQKDN